MWFVWMAVAFIVIVILGALLTNENDNQLIRRDNNKNKFDKYISNNEILMDDKFLSYDNLTGVGVNYKKDKIIVFYPNNEDYSNDKRDVIHKEYKFNDLIESEIIEDGQTVTKSSRASQFKGLAIGSILGGGIGAIVGGLSGDKINNEEIRSIDLKLLFNDVENPIYLVNFLKPLHTKTQSKNTKEYNEAMSNIKNWHGRFKIVIEKLQQQNIN